MVWARVVFGVIIPKVRWTRSPIETKLALGLSILKPVETHIHGLEALGGNI